MSAPKTVRWRDRPATCLFCSRPFIPAPTTGSGRPGGFCSDLHRRMQAAKLQREYRANKKKERDAKA